MIRILVDSSSDYTMAEAHAAGMEFVPITISLNGKSYRDGADVTRDELYESLMNGKEFPKTAQPSPDDFARIFENAKAKGDELICILLSSALSGTVQSATIAKDMVGYDGIYIIDSLSATCAIRLMTDYAKKLIADGLSAAEVAEKTTALIPRVRIAAALDTLEFLHRGGRLSLASAALGSLANVKPVVYVTGEGKVGMYSKNLGKMKAMKSVIAFAQECEMDADFPFYSLYSYGTDNCEKLEEKLQEQGLCPQQRMQIGMTIGAHIGPGAAGVIYVKKA